MAAVTICSDFGAQKNKVWRFPHLFPMKWWDQMPWSSFSESTISIHKSPPPWTSFPPTHPTSLGHQRALVELPVLYSSFPLAVLYMVMYIFIDYTKAFDCVDHNKLWKILQEMGIPSHLTCLLRNLFAGQEATVKTGHGTMNWFQIGKGACQGCILSHCSFNFYAEYIMLIAGLDVTQTGIKIAETYQ